MARAFAAASSRLRSLGSSGGLVGPRLPPLAAPPLQLAGGLAAAGVILDSTALPAGRRFAASCEAAPGDAGIPEVVTAFPKGLDLKKATVRLYQFESCPFCRKARGVLDYSQVPYEIVEVHPLSKAETKKIAADYKKVPVLEVHPAEGKAVQLRDSKTIVKAVLDADKGDSAPNSKVPMPSATASTGKMWPPKDFEGGSTEEQWTRWTDAVLVQCIVLNVYRNMKESAETFSYLLTHPSFPWFAARSAAWSGTAVMWAVARSRKKKYEIPDERQALYESLEHFASAVAAGEGAFFGGSKPGAVDFNVYGILRSTEGCQTERDFQDNCEKIMPWWNAMNKVVGPSQAANKDSVHRGN
mmetsp:Transcript_35092/g.74657  ORF Transcript_35092/g.74657 Transcript_35092/m.74657 type:complete len:356 (-) Transcript_35092:199-1266(-)|eukprot:CAMPEP_0206449146 /NCGR_PEP_ID=MMETSP0324_2-20121206/17918_1 /ASSEMBLY_ACC=CAM_ASM_000836 /TAXON_ID=2866 /ORGANISM="Crypthecodinium cohnii, Strain Seligo" /LENGTH=355 /DNA_ID=CAMNT_0053918473 /DNA_START=105 /DNA_END=1172 /DNA_ORIENTATION=-